MDQWHHFLSRALATRLGPAEFKTFIQILNTKHPLTSRQIANVFLQPRSDNDITPDTRVPQYLLVLIDLGLVEFADILRSLGQYSSFNAPEPRAVENSIHEEAKNKSNLPRRWKDSYGVEEVIVYRLAKMVTHGASPKTGHEAMDEVVVLTAWMSLMNTAGATNDIMQSLGTVADDAEGQANGVRQAFGTLLMALTQNLVVLKALGTGCPKGREILSLNYSFDHDCLMVTFLLCLYLQLSCIPQELQAHSVY